MLSGATHSQPLLMALSISDEPDRFLDRALLALDIGLTYYTSALRRYAEFMGWHDHDIEAWFGPVHATLDHIRFPEEFTLPVRSIGLEQCKICPDYQEPVLHRLALVSHLSALLELNLNGSNTEATDAPTRYSRLGGESGKDRPLAGTRGESPRPSASPAVAVTRSGSVRRVRASCTDVRDAVGTTWSMRDRAASTRCPGGSPSRG